MIERVWLARMYFVVAPVLLGPHARLEAVLRCPGGGTVLDLCTGTGLLARRIALRRPDVRVLGVDLDRAMVAEARRQNRKVANLAFEVADATRLPLGDATVDSVTCALGLHEMPPGDVPRALREACRVLRAGGQQLLLDFNPHARSWQSRAVIAALSRLESYLRGFLALDLTAELARCGAEGIADRMAPGGLFRLVESTRPPDGAQE